jgi:glycosyltransferase involved in cell wall biosynthesis
MAARKPIVGAINGETRKVIEESGSGFCCAAEDYRGLADLILEFCNSNEKDRMAESSYRYYFENFSKARFFSVLESALVDLEG